MAKRKNTGDSLSGVALAKSERQRTEDGGRKTEDGRKKTEDR